MELLDGDPGLFGTSENLIGEFTIYNISVGQNQWIHFFGGHINARKPDVSRGGIVDESARTGGSITKGFSNFFQNYAVDVLTRSLFVQVNSRNRTCNRSVIC